MRSLAWVELCIADPRQPRSVFLSIAHPRDACRLTLKGAADEEAVLCSSNKTYAVKSVETSNLVLLVPDNAYSPDASPLCQRPSSTVASPAGVPGLATQQAKHLEASNRPAITATATLASHLEVVPAGPRLHALQRILADRPYGADDAEEVDAPGAAAPAGATWEELLSCVQASEAEIKAALVARGAVYVGGRWRGIDPGYLGTLLEMLLLTVIEQGWSNDSIPAGDAVAALAQHGYPSELSSQCLKWFGREEGEGGAQPMETEADLGGGFSGAGDAQGRYALAEAEVCRHFALKLLAERPRWEEVGQFEDAWSASVPEVSIGFVDPWLGSFSMCLACVAGHVCNACCGASPARPPNSTLLQASRLVLYATITTLHYKNDNSNASPLQGMTPSMGVLRGHVLKDCPPATGLIHFPTAALPLAAAERFAALFQHRERWQLPDLEPYVEDLPGPGQTVEELLLRYARASQQRPTDPVTYSAR